MASLKASRQSVESVFLAAGLEVESEVVEPAPAGAAWPAAATAASSDHHGGEAERGAAQDCHRRDTRELPNCESRHLQHKRRQPEAATAASPTASGPRSRTPGNAAALPPPTTPPVSAREPDPAARSSETRGSPAPCAGARASTAIAYSQKWSPRRLPSSTARRRGRRRGRAPATPSAAARARRPSPSAQPGDGCRGLARRQPPVRYGHGSRAAAVPAVAEQPPALVEAAARDTDRMAASLPFSTSSVTLVAPAPASAASVCSSTSRPRPIDGEQAPCPRRGCWRGRRAAHPGRSWRGCRPRTRRATATGRRRSRAGSSRATMRSSTAGTG